MPLLGYFVWYNVINTMITIDILPIADASPNQWEPATGTQGCLMFVDDPSSSTPGKYVQTSKKNAREDYELANPGIAEGSEINSVVVKVRAEVIAGTFGNLRIGAVNGGTISTVRVVEAGGEQVLTYDVTGLHDWTEKELANQEINIMFRLEDNDSATVRVHNCWLEVSYAEIPVYLPKDPEKENTDVFLDSLPGVPNRKKYFQLATMLAGQLVSNHGGDTTALEDLEQAMSYNGNHNDWGQLRLDIENTTDGWVKKSALWLVSAGEGNMDGVRHALSIIWLELADEDIYNLAETAYNE